MKKVTVGFLAGTGSAVIMGLSWYATKRISQISGAFIIDVLATRYLISGGVLLLLWVFGKIRLHFEKKDIVPLLGLSLLMPVLYNILEYTAISYISTAEIGMLCSLSTVVASLMGYLILKEPVGKTEAAFMVLAVSGVIFTNVFDFDVHDSSNIGRLLMLGCVLASSLNRILSRKLSSYKTVTEITAIMMWSAAVAFSGIAFGRHLLEGSMNEYVDFIREPRVYGYLIFLSIGCSLLGFWLNNVAIANLAMTQSSVLITISTIVAVVSGAILLQEPLKWYDYVGCFIILTGVTGCNITKSDPICDYRSAKGKEMK